MSIELSKPLEFKIQEIPSVPSLDSDEEESFIVLSKSLIPDYQNEEQNHDTLVEEPVELQAIKNAKHILAMELSQLSEIPSTSNIFPRCFGNESPISVHSISSELSPEEIQTKVESLINENLQLRATIEQNNSSMRAHLESMHQDVQKTFNTHKLKFEEAKNYVSKLMVEKTDMEEKLNKVTEIKKLQDVELFRLKDELKKSSENQIDPQQNDKIEKLQIEIKKKDKLIEQLMEIIKSNTGIPVKDEGNNSLEEKSVNEIKYKEEINNLSQNVRDLNEELKLLKSENIEKELIIKAFQEKMSADSKLDNDNDSIKSETSYKNAEIKEFKDELQRINEAALEKEKKLNMEIINLKSQLLMSESNQEHMENLNQQLTCLQAGITKLEQEKANLIQKLKNNNQQAELMKVSSLNDDVAALQVQLEVYKADFEAEQQITTELKEEKNSLMKQFRQLEKCNNDLIEENELLKRRLGIESGHGSFVHIPGSSSSGSSFTLASEVAENISYGCPICSFAFDDIQALENHVDRCMEMHETLP